MNIAQAAAQRYTTKAFDPSRKIAADDLAALRTLLRNAPSSVNSQPWHFVIAGSDAAKGRIAATLTADFPYNEPKVRNASQVVVLCARESLDEGHLAAILAQEEADGRFANAEAKAAQAKGRAFYVGLHQQQLQDEAAWMDRQVYLALGTLLLGAGALGIDACPIEGFSPEAVDEALGLKAKGLRSRVMVALGYRSEDDFNARLPKSRLPESAVISEI